MEKTAYLVKRRGPEKTCRECGITKPETEFIKTHLEPRNRKRFRRSPYCHACRKIVDARANRAGNLRREFGITLEQYDALLKAQGGRCAICGGDQTRATRGTTHHLCVDHDHRTGEVRGLLCVPCNAMLGNAQESSVILDIARAYLDSYASQ